MNFLGHADGVKDSTQRCVSDTELWRKRIFDVQSKNTPELMRRVSEQANIAQRREKGVKKAARLERANFLSSASNVVSIQRFSNLSAERRGGGTGSSSSSSMNYGNASSSTSEWGRKIQSSASNHRQVDEENNDDEDEDLNDVTNELQVAMLTVMPAMLDTTSPLSSVARYTSMGQAERDQTSNLMNAELHNLLGQLAVEPNDDLELAAKFQLFETFLQTVTTIREETHGYWRENADLFEGGIRVAAQKEVDNIDCENAMGVIDDPSKWFVYGMTKKANENSKKIGQTLSLLRSRLDQIISNNNDLGQCPFCLDDMTPMKESGGTIVLGCCHRVCSDCWKHWQALKGNRAFCPLCRHEEFVSSVLSSANP